ncbi:5-formyltetrahydrofolate cyclo-ligase [Maricaulis salignorans]|uniref:5-formyltetrahydrofolate cyclo-ligase n=1 Tax=Maricaulis salignorans TaxID=144026 RepID=A0A1G9QSQ8_9PROT|nr:5-formyltetrahydrofolate cyclo-ligase [Maricaulis salignorans]SDM13607.1 5-formyltetrahydrofolate cyclo-ligase [Maricaulis salignorans]
MNLQALKSDLRRRALVARQSAHEAAPDAGERLVEHFPFELVTPGSVVSAYWPLPGEMDPRPLMAALEARGACLALPVVIGAGHPLEFREWRSGDPLQRRAFGLMEPRENAPQLVPDILLVPLLAIDPDGNRLGFGKGYYDRTLAGLRACGAPVAVGLAYEAQWVAAVPVDEFDQPLDWVVTEGRRVRSSATPNPPSDNSWSSRPDAR